MRVPGKVFASDSMIDGLSKEEGGLKQVINVAHLPGIIGYSIAMPDIHWGYGFPIGGVAAMDYNEGVVSPGGVGYDINCGVRLVRTNLFSKDVKNKIKPITEKLFKEIPSGVGSEGALPKLKKSDLFDIMKKGSQWAIENELGEISDIEYTEEKGKLDSADPAQVSERAIERGLKQVGTLGSGNHFIELQFVEEIYDEKSAEIFKIFKGQLVIMIHSGSRGLGHQVCEDHIRKISRSSKLYNFSIPDPQLACSPISSQEGQNYLAAMGAAANFAWANRQTMMHKTRKVLIDALGMSRKDLGLELIYDVCHNIAKIETHTVNGQQRKVCVHRKGATRAFPPGHISLPQRYKEIGQPVIIPGDMGRYSYLLVGSHGAMSETFGSSCHGAGRLMSRHKALRYSKNRDLYLEMKQHGVFVQAKGKRTMAEEMPYAYKDVSTVVDVVTSVGISGLVARFRPVSVIKG